MLNLCEKPSVDFNPYLIERGNLYVKNIHSEKHIENFMQKGPIVDRQRHIEIPIC